VDQRRRTAGRIFQGALAFNAALTLFWLFVALTGRDAFFFRRPEVDREAVLRVFQGVLFFYVLWGFLWLGIKSLLLRFVAGFSREERRQAFSSRMDQPFEVSDFLARHSERRIRIVDMIGRRGRFLTLGCAGLFYLYASVSREPSARFATGFLQENLFDAVATSWIFLAFYHRNGILAAAFYGAQSRVMDGVQARANCLLITTLWTAFKFVMVPLGNELARLFPPAEFAAVFVLIWASYMAADGLSEVFGSLFGRQTIRVRGVGDVNRKSVAGTVAGFLGSLAVCLWVVHLQQLPPPWLALSVVVSLSNALIELLSPRGTDDMTMATANALLCWAFGAWMY
jgi:hypothetical protein